VRNAALPTLFLLSAGCSIEPTFRLGDVEPLVVGRSTREEVERRLGPPRPSVGGRTEFASESTEVAPPFPLSIVAWPFYFGKDDREILVKARFDEQGRLNEGTLSLWGCNSAVIVCLFYPSGDGVTLDAAEEESLRAIRRNGFDVRIADRSSGNVLSLEEYLENRRKR